MCFKKVNQFEYPEEAAGRSILHKLNTEEILFEQFGQDWEYRLADESRLDDYISLYESIETSDLEKRVLGCFIINSIEDRLPDAISIEQVRSNLGILAKDRPIHQSEFKYWAVDDEDEAAHMFLISKYIREL